MGSFGAIFPLPFFWAGFKKHNFPRLQKCLCSTISDAFVMASKVEIYTIFQLQQANAYTSQSEISRQVCSKIVSKDVYGFTCICAHMLAIAVNSALLFFLFGMSI